jgi:Family of unknown function (DUF6283)
MAELKPRKTPCASCPYRRDVPSGVWATDEYDRLPGYDGPTGEQAMAGALGVFLCHNDPDKSVCAGWSHLADENTLALRLAEIFDREVDVQAVLDYQTSVPVFASGAEAAEHGKRDIEAPSDEAIKTVRKVTVTRDVLGKPVQFDVDITPAEPGPAWEWPEEAS